MQKLMLSTNEKSKKHKLLIIGVFLAVGFVCAVFWLTPDNRASALSQSHTSLSNKTMAENLSELPGITVVQKESKPGFSECCTATIEQPVDWNNPNGDKFLQYFVVALNDYSSTNIYEISGYNLANASTLNCPLSGFVTEYKPNVIFPEYRFFGNSRPHNLTNVTVEPWKSCCTNEFAARDFHHLAQTLKSLFNNLSCISGTSKGGYTTNFQAYYQEQFGWDDFVAYFPFSAPLCSSLYDGRINEFMQTVGDITYGPEKAAEYRKTVQDFIKLAYSKKDVLAPKCLEAARKDDQGNPVELTPFFNTSDEKLNANRMFDLNVFESCCVCWIFANQDGSVYIDNMSAILKMPEGEEKTNNILKQLVGLLEKNASGYVLNDNSLHPYYLQSCMQMGNYEINFDDIRELTKSDPYTVTITKNDESILNDNIYLSSQQNGQIIFDSAPNTQWLEWANHTSSKMSRVYGQLDIWYGLGVPDNIKGPNTTVSIEKNLSHYIFSNDCSEATRQLIKTQYKNWLIDPGQIIDPPVIDPPQEDAYLVASTSDSIYYIYFIMFFVFSMSSTIIIVAQSKSNSCK